MARFNVLCVLLLVATLKNSLPLGKHGVTSINN